MGATEKRMEQLGIQLQQTDWRGKGAVEAVFAGDILYLSAHFPVDAALARRLTRKRPIRRRACAA